MEKDSGCPRQESVRWSHHSSRWEARSLCRSVRWKCFARRYEDDKSGRSSRTTRSQQSGCRGWKSPRKLLRWSSCSRTSHLSSSWSRSHQWRSRSRSHLWWGWKPESVEVLEEASQPESAEVYTGRQSCSSFHIGTALRSRLEYITYRSIDSYVVLAGFLQLQTLQPCKNCLEC